MRRFAALLIAAVLVSSGLLQADNWPAWRGPLANGVTKQTDLPTVWSPTENIAWKLDLPEAANSTPIVWSDKIFFTQPLAEKNLRTLWCADLATGEKQWQADVVYEGDDPTHKANPFCSASPVTDGERVIVWYGSAGLHCYDLNGNKLWSRDLGEQRHMWGYSSSPIIYKDICILYFGPGPREFVIAVDKKTGETVWQYDEPGPPAEGDWVENGQGSQAQERAKEGQDRSNILRGSWATPLIVSTPARDELIVSLPGQVVSFNPSTGDKLWWCDGLGQLVYGSPLEADGVILQFGGYQAASLAVKTGGSGDVTETHRLWQTPKSDGYLGTGVIKEDHLYTNTINGLIQCKNWKTNEVVEQKRLASPSGRGGTWASLVLAGDKIYAINQSADVFVVEATPEMKVLETNSLEETTNSSVVVAGDRLLIRTHEALWCVGK